MTPGLITAVAELVAHLEQSGPTEPAIVSALQETRVLLRRFTEPKVKMFAYIYSAAGGVVEWSAETQSMLLSRFDGSRIWTDYDRDTIRGFIEEAWPGSMIVMHGNSGTPAIVVCTHFSNR